MKNKVLLSLVIIFACSFYAHYATAGDIDRGEKISQTCMGCHGAPGMRNASPVFSVPMIGGQHAEYLVAALKAYRDKQRSHPTMQAQAASLSDEDMADIAAYYNSLSGNPRPTNVDEDLRAAGEEKSGVCASCHAKTGDGSNPAYPRLAGQYKSYLIQSLKDYRSGARENAIMSGFAGSLKIEDIKALSAWFASQEGSLSAPVIDH